MSDYQVGRLTGKPVLSFGYPILDDRGEVQAVVAGAFDLSWFNRLVAEVQLPPGTTFTIIDRQGTILARHPHPEQWVGRLLPETPLIQKILTQGEGTAEVVGVDGIPRLYAFKPMFVLDHIGEPGSPSEAVRAYVSVGIPSEVAFAELNQASLRHLLGLGLVGLLALAAAWFGSNIFILRQVNTLVKATKRLSAGDLKTRIGLLPGSNELGQLARAFDEMAEALHRREVENQQAQDQILHQAAQAEALVSTAAHLNAQLDLDTILTMICQETTQALGVPAAAVKLYNPEEETLYYACAAGLPSDYKLYTKSSPRSLYDELIQRHGKLIIVPDVQNITDVPNSNLYARLNIRTILTAMMFRESQLIGALNVFTLDQVRHFTHEELTLLKGLANQAAQAIANAWLYAQLEATNRELARSNVELQHFAYIASHDLQEPLRMVTSYTQLLARRYRGKLDADADEFIDYAVDGVSRMQRLINDLLAYSRVETQGKQLKPTSSEESLKQALANLKIAITENKALIIHDALPVVMADQTQLVQLFQNLTSNALKFRGEAPPQVHISTHPKDKEWLFSICDNGIGIEPQYADRIFVIFQRLHTQAEYPGTGIGLAICKRIVERHGGQIWMESQPGQGTTFYFTLPIMEVKQHDG